MRMKKKSRARNFGKKLFLYFNLLVSILFLYPLFFTPSTFIWVNGFLGLIAPYLIIIEILLCIFWLIAKPIMSLVPLGTLVIGWQIVWVVFAWHPGTPFAQKKKENILRVLSWNVKGFNGISPSTNLKLRTEDMAYSIQKWNPDIICLQEYNTNERPNDIANHANYFIKKYPYYFFSKDFQIAQNDYFSGCIIYSKYRILNAARIPFLNGESLISTTILKGDDTIQIFTTHLASYRFKQNEYDAMMDESNVANSISFKGKRGVLRKMRTAFMQRAQQAALVKTQLAKTHYPAIITGDFNDVPSSYTYTTIKGNWQDAFLEKGFGVGASFLGISPTLRIDYILANSAWEVKGWEAVDENLSDHHMIMADLILKK
jgi:endonuclease/exonuclease/phosphatase family metal-dependent hydrolase